MMRLILRGLLALMRSRLCYCCSGKSPGDGDGLILHLTKKTASAAVSKMEGGEARMEVGKQWG